MDLTVGSTGFLLLDIPRSRFSTQARLLKRKATMGVALDVAWVVDLLKPSATVGVTVAAA
jgi:hypothetical protein